MRFGNDFIWFTPAELGFATQSVGAGATVNGNVIPMGALGRSIFAIVFFNVVTTADLLNIAIDAIDETGVIGGSILGSLAWRSGVTNNGSFRVDGVSSTSGGTGAVSLATVGVAMGSPYLRFSVANAGAGANLVTLRMALGVL